MHESSMVSRLDRETEPYHHAADNNRMALMTSVPSAASYLSFLSRIYGFEAPVEAALAMTPRLDHMLDLRGRTRIRLLRADLFALGVVDAATLPRCPSVFPFRHAAAALGWMYTLERNRRLHGIIERHLDEVMSDQPRGYLAARDRSAGERWRELGDALDRLAKIPTIGDQIVLAARSAFRCQHSWYQLAIPVRRRDPVIQLGDERTTVELCADEHNGRRCIKSRGHDGYHECHTVDASFTWPRQAAPVSDSHV